MIKPAIKYTTPIWQMPCAYCGERKADHFDAHQRPECDHCASLPADPVEIAAFQIDEATVQRMTVQ